MATIDDMAAAMRLAAEAVDNWAQFAARYTIGVDPAYGSDETVTYEFHPGLTIDVTAQPVEPLRRDESDEQEAGDE